MDTHLLSLLVCPACQGKLSYQPDRQELVCIAEGIAFPIRDDIPVMLIEETRHLSLDEVEALTKA